jgi:hypothetical protein
MKKHFCKDCHKEVSDKNTKRCQKCYGKSITKYNYCLDCNKRIDRRAKRCLKCAGKKHSKKFKGIPKKDGCSLKIYYCIICNSKISYQSWCYGTKKCKKCGHIKNDKSYNNKCLDCGKHISFQSIRCNSCAKKFAIKTGSFKIKRGKEHWHYKDGTGRDPYGFDFTSKLKLEIRKRDSFKCQYCGMTEEEHLKKYNRVLEIHHKDHRKNNNNKDNLITSCKKCNLKFERVTDGRKA